MSAANRAQSTSKNLKLNKSGVKTYSESTITTGVTSMIIMIMRAYGDTP